MDMRQTAPVPVRSPRRAVVLGSGALIAVGYMDPGNWATDLQAGAQYGYRLASVVVLASVIGILLQSIAATVGAVTGRDLARLCRDRMPGWSRIPMWLAGEVAIIACDAAEVIGAAAALHMLFGLALWIGALVSALLLLPFAWLQQRGRLWLHVGVAVVLAAVVVLIGIQLAAAAPSGSALLAGMTPDLSRSPDVDLLWLAAGIVGATVMPHNLYLHSSLVTPVACQPEPRRRHLLRAIHLDSALSLFLAMLINLALLVLAGAVFHAYAGTPAGGDELAHAARLVDRLLPEHWGRTLFALALLGCSLNGMVTTTLAGQVVMQGFLHIHLSLTQRALLTRGLAIVPALLAVAGYGGHSATPVLVASQVVLGLQLPFAVIPLLWFAGDRRLMGEHRAGSAFRRFSWCIAGTIVLLNSLLLWQTFA